LDSYHTLSNKIERFQKVTYLVFFCVLRLNFHSTIANPEFITHNLNTFNDTIRPVHRNQHRFIALSRVSLAVPICRCGSTSHSRISHHNCPINLRLRRPPVEIIIVNYTVNRRTQRCRCGSFSHRRTNHRNCPLNTHIN